MKPGRHLWAMLLFVAIVLAVNGHWFRAPMVEGSDLAANSLQVYHAKMFREMLGNYSRWHFHHPGPAFFYLFAAGELLFHDWTGLVPGTMNAQMVTLVLVNAAFLFGAIEIFAGYFSGRLFRPLALSGALLWIYAVNHTIPTGAMISAWMPHVALFAFLFFASACASVAAGRIAHLPLAALGAMLMVHLHVAQILFAGVMLPAACATAAVGQWREGRAKGLVGRHWKPLALSAGIVAVFLTPPAIELLVDRPNNLDDIRGYLAAYPDPNLGMAIAGRYFLSFLAFLPDTVSLLQNGGENLAERVVSTPYVATYWAIYLAALCGAVTVARRKGVPRFTWMVIGEIALISALFLYWANRITGALYNFNGFFIYAIQLLALWAIAGMLAAGWRVSAKWARAVWVLPFAAMGLMAGELRNPDRGSEAIGRMSEGLRTAGAVQLVFQHDDWDTAVGIANQLARRGQAFCVEARWYFLFGREYVCRPGTEFARRVITASVVYDPGRWPKALPAVIGAEDVSARREGFYECEGDHCWTGRKASLGFTLAGGAPEYRLTVTGSVLPDRPVEMSMNGVRVGTIDGIWKSSASFAVPGSLIRPGVMNRLTLECAEAGPITGDARQLGLSLMTVEIAAASGAAR